MKRVKQNGEWSLFCPNEALNMHEGYGFEFEELYLRYEKKGYTILEAQTEPGGPFMTYKDHANGK